MRRASIVPLLFALAALLLVSADSPRRSPAVVMPCHVVQVIDGDTLRVEVRWELTVRLIDCWAPEIRGPERELGAKSHAALVTLTGECERDEFLVEVPLDEIDGAVQLSHAMSLGRVLGRVYGRWHSPGVWPNAGRTVDIDVGKWMVANGFASAKKKSWIEDADDK